MGSSNMSLGVRTDLHFLQIGDAFIFFDLADDRYFLLADHVAERFARFINHSADASDIHWLLERGLIVDRCGHYPAVHPITPALSSFVDNPCMSAPLGTVLESLWAQRQARRDLQNRRLEAILAGLQPKKARSSGGQALYHEVAAAFLRARRYASAVDQCLPRGLAMKRMLTRRGCDALLVFGVTMPFAAHCWVQIDDIVLTDPLDIALHYKPIFAV